MISSLLTLLPLLSVALAAPSSGGDSSWSKNSGYSSDNSSDSQGSYSASSAAASASADSGSSYSGSSGSSYGSGSYDSGSYQGGSYQGSSYQGSGGNSWDSSTKTEISVTTITSAGKSYETPSYGSGSWNYGGGDSGSLDGCLQMCQAQFGGGDSGGGGEGGSDATPTDSSPAAATHTIIVAPTMGVLRFVPFAVTANEGDELHYIWGAGPHTTTLSQGDNVCNRSTSSDAFDSGKLNATATFNTKVTNNATTPAFYYCTVMQHCQKGMFGIINPPSTNVSNNLTDQATKTFSAPVESSTVGSDAKPACSGNSMDCWIEQWTGQSADARRIYNGVKDKCSSQPKAWAWGGQWDMSTVITETITKETVIENVMYSRLMLATNPTMLDASQSFPANWTAPPELSSFLVDNSTSSDSASPSGNVGGSAAPSASASASGATTAEAATGSTGAGAHLQISMASLVGVTGLLAAWLL